MSLKARDWVGDRAPRIAIFLQDLLRVLKRSPCKVVLRRAMWHRKQSKQHTRRSAHLENAVATLAAREVLTVASPCHRNLRPPNLVPLHFPFFGISLRKIRVVTRTLLSGHAILYLQIYNIFEKFLLFDIPVPHGSRPQRSPSSSFPCRVHAKREPDGM